MGIIVNKSIAKHVTNFVGISERLAMIQIDTSPVRLNIIQVYAPTADSSEEEVEELYEALASALKQFNKSDMTIVMGDWNAKIGKGERGNLVGAFGLGERNERGDRLYTFCLEHQFVITNTYFKLPPRRLYTWRSPRDQPNSIVRNQIDYILINRRFRNSCTSAKTYPGADVLSDHNPLVGTFKIKLKKVKKAQRKSWDLQKLRTPITEEVVKVRIRDTIKKVDKDHLSIEQQLESLQSAIADIGNTHLRAEKRDHKPWMTQEIMNMMEERRKLKNRGAEYKTINEIIRKN